MSSDDFGTINHKRGERAREIEVLRQHYRQHRDALQRMIADAPTEHLAAGYQRLVVEIDRSLSKLDELEGKTPPPLPVAPPVHEPAKLQGDPFSRPLAPRTPVAHDDFADASIPPGEDQWRSRLPLILLAAIVALAVIGGLIWWASSDRDPAGGAIVEDTAGSTAPDTAIATEPAPAPLPTGLAVTPPSQDYGVIRKGTRATRQFEIANNGDEPLTIQVARSACRCLFYEHAPVIPPKAKENLTVTVDGARAAAGELRESIRVSAKSDPTVGTSFDVTATIR